MADSDAEVRAKLDAWLVRQGIEPIAWHSGDNTIEDNETRDEALGALEGYNEGYEPYKSPSR